MARIQHIIPPRGWELIRNRIAEIIADEMNNQVILNYPSADLEISTWVERSNSFDKTELPAVNVWTPNGTFGNKNQGSRDGSYTFYIDCYCNAASTDLEDGDTLSSYQAQKIGGLISYFLEDPMYNTLGFQRPFIMTTAVTDYAVGKIEEQKDGLNTIMCRITFTVTANENNSLILPKLISGYQTSIKINGTQLGYYYEGNSQY